VSIVTVIENVEIECSNSQQLGNAIDARMDVSEKTIDILLSQNEAMGAHLREMKEAIAKARAASKAEIASHIEALRAIIGGGE